MEAMREILFQIVDEIVDISKEENNDNNNNINNNKLKSNVAKYSILPLLQRHSISPVVSLSPSSSSHITQLKVLKQEKNDSCG